MMIVENSVSTTQFSNEDIYKYINYIAIGEKEYITCKDVDYIVCEFYFFSTGWIFAYSINPSGAWANEEGARCYLSKLDRVHHNKLLDKYIIPCVFIDGVPYLTRETFENEILARISDC